MGWFNTIKKKPEVIGQSIEKGGKYLVNKAHELAERQRLKKETERSPEYQEQRIASMKREERMARQETRTIRAKQKLASAKGRNLHPFLPSLMGNQQVQQQPNPTRKRKRKQRQIKPNVAIKPHHLAQQPSWAEPLGRFGGF